MAKTVLSDEIDMFASQRGDEEDTLQVLLHPAFSVLQPLGISRLHSSGDSCHNNELII